MSVFKKFFVLMFCFSFPQLLNAQKKINEIQVLGSHNSFRLLPPYEILDLTEFCGVESRQALEYSNLPLSQQLDLGVRQIELDIWADPEGGLFRFRPLLVWADMDTDSHLPELDEKGFKVLHLADVDFASSCQTLKSCLAIVKAWADQHPQEGPIMILIEYHEENNFGLLPVDVTIPVPTTKALLDGIDDEIRSVIPEDRLITPDKVRGNFSALEAAVKAKNWPSISESRGKFLFLFDNGDRPQQLYIEGHPSLQGRVMFVDAPVGTPEAGFMKRNDVFSADDIPSLVSTGYLVRTRADIDTFEARNNDTSRRDRAIASGAQLISTDYYVVDPNICCYKVSIP